MLHLLPSRRGFPEWHFCCLPALRGYVSINKEKISDPYAPVTADMLLNDKYILVQRGKKNYYLIIVE